MSVYYPHYACHGLAVRLHNYTRIYLSPSPGGLFSRSSFRHDAREHIFLWKPHHTSLGRVASDISVSGFSITFPSLPRSTSQDRMRCLYRGAQCHITDPHAPFEPFQTLITVSPDCSKSPSEQIIRNSLWYVWRKKRNI